MTENRAFSNDPAIVTQLARIADALERLSPSPTSLPDWDRASAYVWQAESLSPVPVPDVAALPLDLLHGIDSALGQLRVNTERFTRGLPANNALLWGARGMGKSSLVKAVHAAIAGGDPAILILIEIHREDIETLPILLRQLRAAPDRRFVVFCDDLSFEAADQSYKSLKAVLEGGIEGRPANVVFYATSNRRHLLPRDMMDNERSTAINPGEAVEEKVSLSDRFGLWLGFHHCSQDDYLAMCDDYARHFQLDMTDAATADRFRELAIEWSMTRGNRSGRVAWQFIQDYAAMRADEAR